MDEPRDSPLPDLARRPRTYAKQRQIDGSSASLAAPHDAHLHVYSLWPPLLAAIYSDLRLLVFRTSVRSTRFLA